MRNLSTLFVFLFLTAGSLCAEQVFVLFDGTCGDRVLYEQAVANQPRMDYYAYQFPLEGGDRLILETGAEGLTVQNYLPQGYLYCGNPMLDLELVNRVNNGTDKVFVLLPTANNQYLIQPVVMAAAFQRRGNAFSYSSPLTGYQFDADNGIIGVNLAYNNPGAKVYFEGRDNSACSGYFLFRQLKPNSAYPVIDYKLAPELGVIERRLGSDGVNTTGGVIVARQVNGIPVENYLASICAAATASASGQPLPTTQQPPVAGTGGPANYGNQPVYIPPTVTMPVQPESVAATGAPYVTTNTTHTVVKGETLYAISRKYGTTPDAIRVANGMASNTVFPGQQLTVATTQAVAQTTPLSPGQTPSTRYPQAPYPQQQTQQPQTVPTLPYNAGNVASSNPGAAQPTPYQTGAQSPQPYGAGQDARGGTAVYGEDVHVVQPGETVASLALKYGYTSAKFREINELGSNDVVQVGAQLKTSACNCPVAQPVPAPANPATYGTAPAAPQPYSQQPAIQPATTVPTYGQPGSYVPTYGQPAPQVQPTGVRVNGNVPTYNPPAANPQTAPSINNNPNFGQVVPGATAPPSATMRQLESRGGNTAAAANPATYGANPAPVPAPSTYSVPAPAPATYGSAPASPSAYGTPVGAQVNTPQGNAPQTARSYHIVQEGETPYAIARRYNLTTAKLREFNGLNPTDVIVPFQKLYVN